MPCYLWYRGKGCAGRCVWQGQATHVFASRLPPLRQVAKLLSFGLRPFTTWLLQRNTCSVLLIYQWRPLRLCRLSAYWLTTQWSGLASRYIADLLTPVAEIPTRRVALGVHSDWACRFYSVLTATLRFGDQDCVAAPRVWKQLVNYRHSWNCRSTTVFKRKLKTSLFHMLRSIGKQLFLNCLMGQIPPRSTCKERSINNLYCIEVGVALPLRNRRSLRLTYRPLYIMLNWLFV